MAGSLEGNKIVAAVLTAGIIASGAGFFSRVLYHPEEIEADAYPIEVAVTEATTTEPTVEPIAVRLASATVSAGEQVSSKCSSCHSFDDGGPNKVGPNLWNIVGEPIGQGKGYSFSSALADHGGDWTYDNLDGFLADPRNWAPGTKMSFAGLTDPQQRADIIMYLHSLSSDPKPLPEAPTETASADTSTSDSATDSSAAAATSSEQAETATASTEPAAPNAASAEGTSDAQSASADASATGESGAASGTASAPASQEDPSSQPSATTTDAETTSAEAGEAADMTAATEVASDASNQAAAPTSDQSVAANDASAAPTKEASGEAGPDAQPADQTQVAATGTQAQDQEKPAQASAPAASAPAASAESGSSSDAFGTLLASASVDQGESAARKCMACHTFNEGGPNRVGPNLYGIVGEKIGVGRGGYKFSNALASHGGEWTYQNLNEYLTNPREWAPGTRMSFAGIKDEKERADVIAYLRSLSKDPLPLP